MGSTGHGLWGGKRGKNTTTETFKILGAVVFKGKLPPDTGLQPPASNNVTLKVPADDGTNILFQFKLSKDNKTMRITGFNNSIPVVKCEVAVDSGQPSLDKVIATGSRAERLNATKMKDLFSKSTEVKENQLGSIATELLRRKRQKGETT